MEEYEDSEEGQKSKVNDAKIDKVRLINSRVLIILTDFSEPKFIFNLIFFA